MLQVGGVHVAMIAALPASGVVTMGSRVLVAQFVAPTLMAAGLEEHQVKGTPVMVAPAESITVGVMVFVVPFVTLNELLVVPVTSRLIDCTRQVAKGKGTLVTLLVVAKIEVKPGVPAVTCTWPSTRPSSWLLGLATLSVTTPAVVEDQVNVPTVGVMSFPRLNAVAR